MGQLTVRAAAENIAADIFVGIRQRDKHMSNEIEKVINQNDVDQLLVIVGKDHIIGLLKHLKGKGFKLWQGQ